MSRNVISYGAMAPITAPTGDLHTDAWSARSEFLLRYNLYINYEGTLIFSDRGQNGEEVAGLWLMPDDILHDFLNACGEAGIQIDDELIVPYAAVWYNGADSYMSDLTLEKFCDQTASMRQT